MPGVEHMRTSGKQTYQKRFRLSVVVVYESEEPLNSVSVEEATRELQQLLDNACEEFGSSWLVYEPTVEHLEPARSLREQVDRIIRALERKGYDVT